LFMYQQYYLDDNMTLHLHLILFNLQDFVLNVARLGTILQLNFVHHADVYSINIRWSFFLF
jgi:hypothetical protein